ncbi:MAG: hypothetical protein V4505_02340 [Pseudomonadota bacterium]
MSFLKKLFGGSASAPEESTVAPLGARAYAEAYAASVRAAHPGMPVQVEHGDSAARTRVFWQFPGGLAVSQFMGNSYSRYRQSAQAPGNGRALLAELFAEQLADAHQVQARSADRVGDAAQPQAAVLLPVVKTTGWQQTVAAQLDAAQVPPERRPFSVPLAGSLVLAYVEDSADAMDYVSPARMQALGLDAAALHSQALHNLESTLLPQLDVQGGGGRYAARLDHNYDTSMVLLFDRWRQRIAVEGDPVIALAARDELLLCGSADTGTVAGLRGMAAEILAQSAYGLTDELFVWRGGRLEPYTA